MGAFRKFLETFDERTAFEKRIDENPADSLVHLVFADWLDEHDDPREAEFQRALGKWLKNFNPHDDINYPPAKGFPWAASRSNLPEGVDQDQIEIWGRIIHNGDSIEDQNGTLGPKDPTAAIMVSTNRIQLGLRWQTYRGMEQAFRNAFKK